MRKTPLAPRLKLRVRSLVLAATIEPPDWGVGALSKRTRGTGIAAEQAGISAPVALSSACSGAPVKETESAVAVV
jgi:hypothetical protein